MMADATNRAAWDAAYAKYRALDLLFTASEQFGPDEKSVWQYKMAIKAHERQYGPSKYLVEGSEGKRALCDLIDQQDAKDSELLDLYYCPASNAAWAMLEVPAPDLDAIEAKITATKKYELETSCAATREPFDIIAEDVARLTA